MPLQEEGDIQMNYRQRLGLASSEFFWNIVPGWLGRLSPALGVISQDGWYLSKLPVLGNFLAVFGMLVGIAVGYSYRGGLPYTANFEMLALLLVLGILSGQAGFWVFLGFVAADAIGLVRVNTASLSLGYAGAVLISWFFLFQLVAGLPLAARLMGGLKGRWAFLNGLVAAIFASGFTELWTRLSMVALRPLSTWRGREPALELVNFIQQENDWTVGPLALHKLAWLALATGLARWILTPLVLSFYAPVSAAGQYDRPASARKVPWWLSAFGKAASVTAIIAGMFTTIAGAFFFCFSILGAVTLRTFASAYRIVAVWDGWMFRIPAAIRLIASYALCFHLAVAMVALFRDMLAWRTMTTAVVATATVFAVSLLFWPQVSPGEDAPVPPMALQGLLRATREAVPCVALLVLMSSASAAFAHHCSFQPGCECLTDKGALAALVAAAASLAQLSSLSLDPTKALEYAKIATSLAQLFAQDPDAEPDSSNIDPKLVDFAKANWLYATLSNNVYEENDQFPIPPKWKKMDTSAFDGLSGFYAQTWIYEEDGKVSDVIMAFRGTETRGIETAVDWANNLFPAHSSPQQEIAKVYGQMVAGRYPDANIVATGHSLGGALAKSAVDGTEYKAIVFNSSPRGAESDHVIQIEEEGDILDYFRKNSQSDIQFDLNDDSPLAEHSIYDLAKGIRTLAGQ